MAKRRIFTVGFDLPGDDFEHVPFRSNQTLLDADVILFEPTLGDFSSIKSYSGKPLLTETSSFATKEQLDHWRSEIAAAVNAGKIVVVYLAEPTECYRYTGEKNFSGTGRSRVTTDIVTTISSYEAVPNIKNVNAKKGTEIRVEKDAGYIKPYWSDFSAYSPYEAEIEGDFGRVLLKSRTGDRVVGAAIHGVKGFLIFLPPLRYDEKKFVRHNSKTDESFWTDEAQKFGKRLVSALASLADTLMQSTQVTPVPAWALESRYRLAKENELEAAISTCTADISQLQEKKNGLEAALGAAGSLRGLLYEQGRPLESAIIEALILFGFEAKPVSDGKSEFDVVFVSAEGRCLGEAEGKDNKAINIDKFSQLERNIQEDFSREEVSEYAKAVLFGNAYRLQSLDKRPAFFTDKCVSAAARVHAVLVRTPDLFGPAKYLKENPHDADYAKQCRDVLFVTEGEVVAFPATPIGDANELAESPPQDGDSKRSVEVDPENEP